jgi:3-deoxy-7-phosphoheptulonate synthase
MSLATEILEPLTVPYLDDCFTWGAIGARTTESQVHRQIVSGLSMPVGFKNGTDGNVQVALSAMQSAASSHTLLGVNTDGQISLQTTFGNPSTHVILRGGASGPNYSEASVSAVLQRLPRGSHPQLMVDCAHGNSGKDPTRQPVVAQAVAAQFGRSDVDVLGVMLESHVREGTQPVKLGAHPHQSITDPCLGFEETALILEQLALAAACTSKRPPDRSHAKAKTKARVRPVVSQA